MARPIQDSVILFGDSLTSRQAEPGSLQSRFSEKYRRQLDVLNRGFGGFTTETAVALLDQILMRKDEQTTRQGSNVRLMTIWYGTNDSVLPGVETGQNVPLESYIRNLNEVLDLLTSSSSPYAIAHQSFPLNVILITPPAMYSPAQGDSMDQRDPKVTKKYAEAVLQIGREWKDKAAKDGSGWRVGAVDLWTAIEQDHQSRFNGEPAALEQYFTDGLHLSTLGYTVLFDKIESLIKTDFVGRGIDWDDLDGLPFAVPDWSNVDKASKVKSVLSGMKQGYRRQE